MKTTRQLGLLLAAWLTLTPLARAVSPTAGEMAEARRWVAAKFEGVGKTKPSEAFFSLVYEGKPSAQWLKTWPCQRSSRPLGAQRTEHTLTWTDARSGLTIRCVAVEYRDFPAVEWVIHLQNAGKADTSILESIQALDAALALPKGGQAVLHWAKGGVASFDDFAPQETALKPGATVHLAPGGGRSSNGVLPFFNVAHARGGTVLAVGWSGEWAADISYDPRGLLLKAGMAHTHLLLHPGETIRTPRILMLFYEQDRWRGQNLLRQFLVSYHRPRCNGQPLVAPVTWGTWGGTRGDVHLDYVEKIIRHKLPIDYYWIDAEWYGQNVWWKNVGDWQVRKDLYPDGFKPLSDALRSSGRHLMLWFEPERVFKGTPWHKAHRDWLLDIGQDNCLWNLGHPRARQFVTDFISSRVEQFGLGCYRQDFNMSPLPYWKAADAPDRQGMAEIRYIEGLYAFWDELLARHPGLIIDNCASGGRRIDLETTGRSTPFWRTDGPRDAVAHQCHTYGLMAWVPLSATSQDREGDVYEFRSSMSSALCVNWFHSGDGPMKKLPADFPFAWGKQVLEQYLTLRPLYYGDYYPLTPYSQQRGDWMAWQFDRPDLGQGMVQAFRRDQSVYESARLKLHSLEPDAVYALTNLDVPGTIRMTGRELTTSGLSIAIKDCPGAVIVTYQKSK